ncbi:MAG TPA: alpha/beta hydrolase [Caulobacteraceae bacterium]|nr:alpha/beta hydrolase [Caulobacteraceae bacterium]
MSHPITERFVEGADGVRLFVREGGERRGAPILFIHGYLFSADAYVRQFSGPLAETHRLVAMDLRGHGRSDKPADRAAYLDTQALADDIARVVAALQLDHVTIVGWSMGSRMALNYGWHYGFDRIAGLNLVSAVVRGPSRGPGVPLRPHLTELFSTDTERRWEATRDFVRSCASGAELDPDLEKAFIETAMATPVDARSAIREWPLLYKDALPKLQTPVLVTHGIGDDLVPEADSRELAALLPRGRLSLIGGGHLPFLLDAQRFDTALTSFAQDVLESQMQT